MSCETCKEIEARKGNVIYSDPYSHVILPEDGATKGHIRVYPKTHAEGTDGLEHEEIQHLFKVANITATVLFETLGAQGTNIIMNEGKTFNDHVSLEIVARNQDDDMNIRWDPKELSESDMEEAQKRIKDKADMIGMDQPKPDEPRMEKKPAEKIKSDDDNYMLKQIKRLP